MFIVKWQTADFNFSTLDHEFSLLSSDWTQFALGMLGSPFCHIPLMKFRDSSSARENGRGQLNGQSTSLQRVARHVEQGFSPAAEQSGFGVGSSLVISVMNAMHRNMEPRNDTFAT
jgi:hypothetical protein